MAVSFEFLEVFNGTRDGVACNDVRVLFTSGDIEHERFVNVCRDENNEYDHDATTQRVFDLCAGIERKIELGVIKATPTEVQPPTE